MAEENNSNAANNFSNSDIEQIYNTEAEKGFEVTLAAKHQEVKEVQNEISSINVKTKTKFVQSTNKNQSSEFSTIKNKTKHIKDSNSLKKSIEKIQGTLSLDTKIVGKKKLPLEGIESVARNKKAFSLKDRLIRIKDEKLERIKKIRCKEKQDDGDKNEKISLKKCSLQHFENDEQSKIKLEEHGSQHTTLTQKANISKATINTNTVEFSSNVIYKNGNPMKKISVNERLSRFRQELMLKHHSTAITRNIIPTIQKKRFSVNDRLKKLKQELQAKQHTANTNTATCFRGTNIQSLSFSSKCKTKIMLSNMSENPKTKIQADKTSNMKFSVNDKLKNISKELKSRRGSAMENNLKTARENVKLSTKSELPEAMEIDGEDLSETEEEFVELESIPMDWDSIGQEIDKNIEEIRCQAYEDKDQTLSEHYDVVDRNLLKLFAETNKSIEIYEDSKYYFVIDTNVFLKDLYFLNKLNNCETNKMVLIVPYVVLQELDSLKIRRSQAVSTLAVRAIKYLNDIFGTKKSNTRGQSAVEAENHLITIKSADDYIINCCLQIKAKTQHAALLTYDINLKNKARSSDIKCLSKEDFENLQII